MGQCYKTFYHDNLQPFCGNYHGNIVLKHRITAIPCNGSKVIVVKRLITLGPGPCTIKHYGLVIYRLLSILVYLFVQASVFVQARIH